MKSLHIAVAAEFDLCEKIAEFLQLSQLDIERLSVIEIYPFKEEQSIRFQGKAVAQISAEEAQWADFDYLLFGGDINQVQYLATAAQAGCIGLDIKGVCSSLSDVPVVVPEVNPQQLIELRQRNIVSLPDPIVSQLALAIAGLVGENAASRFLVSTLLPASYENAESVTQLIGQTAQLLNGIPLEDEQQRLAFDVYPARNEQLQRQLQKIFPQLNDNLVFHSIHVPVFYGMAQMVTGITDYAADREAIIGQWQSGDLIRFHENKGITPVINGERENGEELVHLHISDFSLSENEIRFWSVADEQRFNIALLAVRLLELIYRQGY
ncbi:aspartate-semialdehyde dehydrogenase [Mesocricetibacter intestinalis]|uniref:Aspartate-semialdehyde dehydrogenase n=1 Tax=Mesocricetibacter intestinalis TaxID=1521930 RepID=A0A4R6VAT4_9PAST|nr:oxidoreductase [Mesocricetibacter intestinalis]TDQ59006.1 aspartate-semialdehyde dehydrogenase [Mesocricetibacter intestinalis]